MQWRCLDTGLMMKLSWDQQVSLITADEVQQGDWVSGKFHSSRADCDTMEVFGNIQKREGTVHNICAHFRQIRELNYNTVAF